MWRLRGQEVPDTNPGSEELSEIPGLRYPPSKAASSVGSGAELRCMGEERAHTAKRATSPQGDGQLSKLSGGT